MINTEINYSLLRKHLEKEMEQVGLVSLKHKKHPPNLIYFEGFGKCWVFNFDTLKLTEAPSEHEATVLPFKKAT